MGLKLSFESGFSQTLKKQRLANLLEISQLLQKNLTECLLTQDNLNLLRNAALEISTFYMNSAESPRELELLAQQLESSTSILTTKLTEGKIHKASVRSLGNTIAKLHPVINDIIEKQLPRDSARLSAIVVVRN
jgi:hypothetical protein